MNPADRVREAARAAFEKWWNSEESPNDPPKLTGVPVVKACAWDAWQAALALPVEPAKPDEVGRARGVELIAAERRRQIEAEGWTPAHDDEHGNGELALAAACYALATDCRGIGVPAPAFWPWDDEWWKPTPNDRVRELVKAGALISAEIDRLNRAAERAAKEGV